MKTALVTGVTGQDGAYLAEFLLGKGYEVHGIKRRTSLFNTDRVDHLYQDPHEANRQFILHHGDLTDSSSLIRIIQQVQPDEIYNLAAQSHVAVSFEEPEYTANSDAIGALRLLEAIRILGLEKKTRFYQASTSELYGLVQETPQTEKTPFYPRSPYAVAKLYAYWITVNYREAYGIYACNGIMFNHESRCAVDFVTRKITRGLARIKLGVEVAFIWAIWMPSATGGMPGTTEMRWLMLQPQPENSSSPRAFSTRARFRRCGSTGDLALRSLDREGRGGEGLWRRRQVPGGGRSPLFSTDRGRDLAGRPVQGQTKVGLDAKNCFPGVGRRDDAGGSQSRRA